MNAFQITDGGGTEYVVVAVDLGEAYRRFRAHESIRMGLPAEEIEEPQRIQAVGEYLDI